MIRLKKISNYPLSRRERFYNVLGLIILAVAGIAALIAYGLGSLFSGKPWQLVTPWLHVISAISGALLAWLGSGNVIKQERAVLDASLERFWQYRVLRWMVIMVFGIIWFVVNVIFLAWIDESPEGSEREVPGDESWRGVDLNWEVHPQHYYDIDPPEPFS